MQQCLTDFMLYNQDPVAATTRTSTHTDKSNSGLWEFSIPVRLSILCKKKNPSLVSLQIAHVLFSGPLFFFCQTAPFFSRWSDGLGVRRRHFHKNPAWPRAETTQRVPECLAGELIQGLPAKENKPCADSSPCQQPQVLAAPCWRSTSLKTGLIIFFFWKEEVNGNNCWKCEIGIIEISVKSASFHAKMVLALCKRNGLVQGEWRWMSAIAMRSLFRLSGFVSLLAQRKKSSVQKLIDHLRVDATMVGCQNTLPDHSWIILHVNMQVDCLVGRAAK